MGGLFAKQATQAAGRTVVRTKKDKLLIDEAEHRLAALKSEQLPTKAAETELDTERLLRDPNFEAAMLDIAAGITVFSANTAPGQTEQASRGSFANRHLLNERRGEKEATAEDQLQPRNPVGPVVGDVAQSTATLAARYRQRALARARVGSPSFSNVEVGPKDLIHLLDTASASRGADSASPAFDFLSEHDRSLIHRYYRTWQIHTVSGRKGRLISYATWPNAEHQTRLSE